MHAALRSGCMRSLRCTPRRIRQHAHTERCGCLPPAEQCVFRTEGRKAHADVSFHRLMSTDWTGFRLPDRPHRTPAPTHHSCMDTTQDVPTCLDGNLGLGGLPIARARQGRRRPANGRGGGWMGGGSGGQAESREDPVWCLTDTHRIADGATILALGIHLESGSMADIC